MKFQPAEYLVSVDKNNELQIPRFRFEDLQAMILEITGKLKKAPPMPTISVEKIGEI